MVKNIFVILFLLYSSTAHAAYWVCFDETKMVMTSAIGDGVKLGIANDGYAVIDPECIKATEVEYNDSLLPYKRIDHNIVMGNRIVDWSQAEIDTQVAAEAAANTNDVRTSSNSQVNAFNQEAVLVRALALVVLDEINNLRTELSLANRTISQLKKAIKNKINTGGAD